MLNSASSKAFRTILPFLVALPGALACSSGPDETQSIAPPASGSESQTLTVAPEASGIEHVVVLMMENRSFDHFMGWVPGADGKQAGLAYPNEDGTLVPTHALAPDFQGCAHPDPDHSYEGGRVAFNGGACDGWLSAGLNDEFSIGYYTQADLSFFGQAARRWTVMDRYFSSIMAETFPNRFYQHAAQTDRLTNTLTLSLLPTIWDRLAEKGVSARYYFSDIPFLALWGPKYLPISRPVAQFLSDAVNGTLPAVSFIDPRFLGEQEGVSGDDHPHSDIRNGEAFMNIIYTAVTRSKQWKNTVFVINYDEWGGFFDHVPPPTAPIPPADVLAGNQDGRLGFRTASLLVSPWSRPGTVSHTQFDHTSVLKMIEWRWGLAPLTVRDATANNLAEALDFSQKNVPRPTFDVPLGPFGAPCPGTLPEPPELDDLPLGAIGELADLFGYPTATLTNAELSSLLGQLLLLRQ